MESEYFTKLFLKDFNNVCKELRTETELDISQLSLPLWRDLQVDTRPKVYIKNLSDMYYSGLNNNKVTRINQKTVDRDIYWRNGDVKKVEKYTVPKGSIIISTMIDLCLPFGYEPEEKGLEYIDFKQVGDIIFYYYSIPEKYCYNVNITALVASEKKKPNHYGGVEVLSTTGYSFYLYIVDIKGLKNIRSQKVLRTGDLPEYHREFIKPLLYYWIQTNEIFKYTDLEMGMPINNKGATNPAYNEFEATSDYSEKSEFSIAEQRRNSKQL